MVHRISIKAPERFHFSYQGIYFIKDNNILQQVSSDLQNSSWYSSWSHQYCCLDGFDSSWYPFLPVSFPDSLKLFWCIQIWLVSLSTSCSILFQLADKVGVFIEFFDFFYFNFVISRNFGALLPKIRSDLLTRTATSTPQKILYDWCWFVCSSGEILVICVMPSRGFPCTLSMPVCHI